jgi:hypothetical protein
VEHGVNRMKITENLPQDRRGKQRAAWRKQQLGVSLLLGLFFLLGFAALLRENKELFPFYSWSMFGLVPQTGECYRIVLTQVPGRALAGDLPFQEADEWVTGAHSVVAAHVLIKLGRALEDNDAEKVALWRRQFETNYLRVGTHYKLVRDFSNPVERWKKIPARETVLVQWIRES